MPIVVWILLGIAAAATLAHGLFTVAGLGKPQLAGLFNQWVYDGVLVVCSIACLLRGVLVRAERTAWLVIAAGVWSWTLGDIYWNYHLSGLEEIPYPSLADGFYIAGYPALYVGIALLARGRRRRFDSGLWLDGLLGALAVGAIGSAFLYPAFEGTTQGNVATVAVNLAYPLGDLLLLSFVVAGVALAGWRPDRGWALLGAGLAVIAVGDGVYLVQEATVGYASGSWPDTLWLLGTGGIAAAAWNLNVHPERHAPRAVHGTLALPATFALTGGVAIQMWDHFRRVGELSAWLSGATLLVVVVRMTLAFQENLGLLRRSQVEASIDPLTGLGNRRRLMQELEEVSTDATGRRRILAMFDLDGFKAYNDTFGHPAGDVLLTHLGHKLEKAVGDHGAAYRLGGDEFCVLAALDRISPDALLEDASVALCDTGEGFSIGSSRGAVLIPDETRDPEEALRLADRRMYGQKGTRPRSPRRQTIDVLLSTIQEREAGFETHLRGVADLAIALGRKLGLEAEDLDVVGRGAELHDVGKMAVPDEILHKPGPLTPEEWKVMHKHTLVGERILASAPALLPVAKLVRSSHERWDGGGYPDGLVGEGIPLGARIITICDSYEAMVEDRPWRTPKSPEQALEELWRCAGSQFDPALVEVFAREVFPEVAKIHAGSPSTELAFSGNGHRRQDSW